MGATDLSQYSVADSIVQEIYQAGYWPLKYPLAKIQSIPESEILHRAPVLPDQHVTSGSQKQ